MKLTAIVVAGLLASLALGGIKKSWEQSYEAGLTAARSGKWSLARDCFKSAIQDRANDSPKPTYLPGDPTEPQRWRNGAPYSPNFLAAYSAYRAALLTPDVDEQTKLLATAAVEFEKLLDKGESSRDTYFLLDMIYSRQGDTGKRQSLAEKMKKRKDRFGWKVDEDVVAPEEVAAMNSYSGTSGSAPSQGTRTSPPGTPTGVGTSPVIRAGESTTGQTGVQANPITPGLGMTNVPPIPDKFALVISEAGDKLAGGQVPFANQDADTVKNGLINFAGYSASNVVTLHSPKASEILDAAKALAAKVPQDGTVLLYYVGPGSCLNGKDYLVGSEAETLTDPDAMTPKLDLYSTFTSRGARLFCFFEVNRPIVNGSFFGSEVPRVGAISQMQATIPDGDVTAIYFQGNQVGLYAQSFSDVLSELRSNRVPIYEFGWQLYNKMRRGNTGTSSGASHQIPTLPYSNNLAADARF